MAHDNNIAENIQKPAQVRIAILLLYTYSVIILLVDLVSTTINGGFSIRLIMYQAIDFLFIIFFVFTISKGKTWPRNLLLLFFIGGIFSSMLYLSSIEVDLRYQYIISVITYSFGLTTIILLYLPVITYSFGLITILLLYLKPAKQWFGQFVVENSRTNEVMIDRRVFFGVSSFLLGGLSIYFMFEKFVYQREEQPTIGYYWFLPAILILLWIGMYLGAFPGIVIALFVGWLLVGFFGGPLLPPNYGYHPVITPVAPTIFGGLVGCILASLIDKKDKQSGQRWEVGMTIVGLILGFGIGFWLYAGSVG